MLDGQNLRLKPKIQVLVKSVPSCYKHLAICICISGTQVTSATVTPASLTSTSAIVVFNSVTPCEVTTQYKVDWGDGSAFTTESSYSLSGLTPCTDYTVTITCATATERLVGDSYQVTFTTASTRKLFINKCLFLHCV